MADGVKFVEPQARELGSELVAVGRHCSAGQHRLVTLAAAFDASGGWVLDRAATCAHWIAGALDVEICTAREWIRIGHALARLPLIDAALVEGRISYSKARSLTRVATPENEAELLAIAESVPAGHLSRALAMWLMRHETPEETEARQQRARGLRWWTDCDGMVVASLRLPPLDGAVFTAAVDAQVLRHARSPRRAEGDGNAPAGAWGSFAQQRCDALSALVRQGGGAGTVTEVVVHLRGDGCTLDDGTPISDHAVARLLESSFIRALIHDAERRPINASGRQRHPTKRQERVVQERDRTCVDCGSTDLLQCDHDPPFAETHQTVVDELRLRDPVCHTARHAREGGLDPPSRE